MTIQKVSSVETEGAARSLIEQMILYLALKNGGNLIVDYDELMEFASENHEFSVGFYVEVETEKRLVGLHAQHSAPEFTNLEETEQKD